MAGCVEINHHITCNTYVEFDDYIHGTRHYKKLTFTQSGQCAVFKKALKYNSPRASQCIDDTDVGLNKDLTTILYDHTEDYNLNGLWFTVLILVIIALVCFILYKLKKDALLRFVRRFRTPTSTDPAPTEIELSELSYNEATVISETTLVKAEQNDHDLKEQNIIAAEQAIALVEELKESADRKYKFEMDSQKNRVASLRSVKPLVKPE